MVFEGVLTGDIGESCLVYHLGVREGDVGKNKAPQNNAIYIPRAPSSTPPPQATQVELIPDKVDTVSGFTVLTSPERDRAASR